MPELSITEKLVQALNVLDPVSDMLTGAAPAQGNRASAEAFLANAPTLFGHQLPFEKLLLSLDVAVSALQADPSLGAAYAYIATALYRIGYADVDIYAEETLANALPWAQRGTDVEPLSREAWEALNEIHCYRGDFAAAEKALGEIFSRWGDGDVYARSAFLYFRLMGDAEQAMNWGALAWQQEWNNDRLIQTLFALGQLYRDNNRIRQAADVYRVLCEHEHDSLWGHHFRARCEFELGNLNEALAANTRAIELGGGHALRGFQEEIKHAMGRARLGLKPNAGPMNKGQALPVVAPPPAAKQGEVPPPPPAADVVAPPPAAQVVAPPPAFRRIKGPNIGRVVAAPPPAKAAPGTVEVKAPPPLKPTTQVNAPPPKKPTAPALKLPAPLKKKTQRHER